MSEVHRTGKQMTEIKDRRYESQCYALVIQIPELETESEYRGLEEQRYILEENKLKITLERAELCPEGQRYIIIIIVVTIITWRRQEERREEKKLKNELVESAERLTYLRGLVCICMDPEEENPKLEYGEAIGITDIRKEDLAHGEEGVALLLDDRGEKAPWIGIGQYKNKSMKLIGKKYKYKWMFIYCGRGVGLHGWWWLEN
ncbi:hypothetical protein HD554DRAFT_2038329 [Boletus coccyginus]|nr:hypothetical protein HD554DRAFT_2038329 [Boletus coccyginus]